MDKSEIESRFDLQALDGALDCISLAAVKDDVDRKNFYDLVNFSISDKLANSTSLIFIAIGGKSLRLVSQSGPELTRDRIETISEVLCRSADREGTHVTALADSQLFYCQHDLERYQIAYAIVLGGDLEGMEKKLLSDLVSEVGLQISLFERHQLKKNQARIQSEILKVTQLVRNLSLARSSRQMAYTLVNDLLPVSAADRITFFTVAEGILAISKVASFDNRNEVTRGLSQFARLTAHAGETVDWSDFQCTHSDDRTGRKLGELTRKLGASHGLAIPIADQDGHPIGNLIFEYFSPWEEANFLERRTAIENCVDYCAPLIQRMYQMYSIPYFSFWEWMFNSLVRRSARTFIRLGIIALMFGVLIYALLFVQRPFDLAVDGVLQPTSQRHVFAPEQGDVRELLVSEGDVVGEDSVLVKLKSASLEKEIVSVSGELAEVKQRLRDLELTSVGADANDDSDAPARAAAETQRLKIRQTSLQTQKDELEQRRQRLAVYSPLRGQVTTPNLEQRLHARPLNRGDIIMTVADLEGDWHLELLVPDFKITYLTQYLSQVDDQTTVRFRLASNNELTFTGQLDRLDFRAENHSTPDQKFVRAFVELDEDQMRDHLRIGTRVTGRISCGKRNLLFLLTHEFRDKLSEWFFF